MELTLGIDLAERNTAAVALDDAGEVRYEAQLDAGPRSDPFTSRMAKVERWCIDLQEDLIGMAGDGGHVDTYLEDVFPHAVRVDAALRLSGVLWYLMWSAGFPVTLVKPLLWQREMGYKRIKGRSTKAWAKLRAAEIGYVPEARKRNVTTGHSIGVSDDLCDAFLIAYWARGKGIDDEDVSADPTRVEVE